MQDLVEKKLAVVLFQNDFIKISLKGKVSLVVIKWLRQINLEERIVGFKTAFEIVKKLQIKNLLVDNEQIFLISEGEKFWMAQAFNQWIIETQIEKFAIVTSDLYKNLIDLSKFVDDTKQNFQLLSNVEHEFFTDYETALLWFKENRYS